MTSAPAVALLGEDGRCQATLTTPADRRPCLSLENHPQRAGEMVLTSDGVTVTSRDHAAVDLGVSARRAYAFLTAPGASPFTNGVELLAERTQAGLAAHAGAHRVTTGATVGATHVT